MKFCDGAFFVLLLSWPPLFTVYGKEEETQESSFPLEPLRNLFNISSFAKVDTNKKSDRKQEASDDSELGFSYKVPNGQRDQVLPYGRTKKKNRDHKPYGLSGNLYAYGALKHNSDSIGHRDATRENSIDDHQTAVIAGIPDLSDPCFRRYANTIIVNAQPYERRSTIALVNCKSRCLESQIGVYSCRSFVFDNINQVQQRAAKVRQHVCDLFAHVGDQSPARLLRFQSRDYFEPTAAISCSTNSEARLGPTGETFLESTTLSTVKNTVVEVLNDENNSLQQSNTPIPFQPTPNTGDIDLLMLSNSIGPQSCKDGEIPRFLRTQDFALDGHDDLVLENISLEICIRLCLNNFVNGTGFKCSSFDYSLDKCILSNEVAVPLGNGQLKQAPGVAYYEKVCVEEKLANDCPIVYNRFPQKILVGFAETVIDAPTLQECFDNCLNSQKLYGFRCISGMYYFEEPQLNCILNTEDRTTQAELFANENTDLVDYFETGCNKTSSSAEKRFASNTRKSDVKKRASKFTTNLHAWTNWMDCNGKDSKQTRTKMCVNDQLCGHEERDCTSQNSDLNPEQLLTAIRKANCIMDKCCKIFNHCNLGIVQASATHRLDWCTNPCI